ncbi:PepSY-associated TM helix domain-containing protein [Zhongshania sp.]|uniref:PepSY-associated TM helix domain-containing protein n=1 Tax=Zhongshania sp. TaxID=1971902 RepID=UPI00356521C7
MLKFLHRYLGLTVGSVYALLGLTGSILVFDHSIDEALNSDIYFIAERGNPLSLQLLMQRAQVRLADGGRIVFIEIPNTAGRAYRFFSKSAADDRLEIFVNPYTGEVIDTRIWGNYFTSLIYDLHSNLVSGSLGHVIVGIVGLVVLLMLLSGLYRWWPKKRRWRSALLAQGRAAPIPRLFDLHRLTGAYMAVFLIVSATSGVYLCFPGQFKAVVAWALPVADPEAVTIAAPSPGTNPAAGTALDLGRNVDTAIALGKGAFPMATLSRVYPPATANDPIKLRFSQPGEVNRRVGRSEVLVDPYRNTIVTVKNPFNAPVGDSVLYWLFPLHNGEAFDLLGRCFVFVLGFVPPILFGSGLLFWRKRQQTRLKIRRTACRAR